MAGDGDGIAMVRILSKRMALEYCCARWQYYEFDSGSVFKHLN
jgi:hypothetical protein